MTAKQATKPRARSRALKSTVPSAVPRKATEAEVSEAERREQRITNYTHLDQATAIDELTAELGSLSRQVVVQRAIIRRLITHILTIDPDDQIAQQTATDLERANSKES